MNTIKTLVAMQLKEKLNLKGKNLKSKHTLFKLIYGVLKFLLICMLCYVILFLCRKLNLFSLINYIPTSVMAIVFLVMFSISIISATFSLTKSLYYSYDNSVLLTLPCRPTQVYISKLVLFYIYELMRNLSFIVPLFIAFGLVNGLPIYYYPWILFCFLFISLIPILIGAILSIPLMWFYNFFRNYKKLQIGCLLVLIGLVTYIVVSLIKVIPSNIDLIGTWGTTFWKVQDILNTFTIKFKYIYQFVIMLVGTRVNLVIRLFTVNSLIYFLIMLALIGVLFFVGLLIVKPLFYKMASKPFEYRKENKKIKPNKVHKKGLSILKNELLLSLRDPDKLFTNVGLLIAMPVLILFLNKLFAAMNTRMLGNNMAIAFNVLIILLISLTSSYYAASVFSKDGRSSYLIKVQPSKYQPLLFSKLVFSTVFMVISFIVTYFVLVNNTSIGNINCLMLILACMFIYFAHLFYSAEMDIMNPQIELYATVGSSDNNPNEGKSIVLAFLIAFFTFGALLLLLIENNGFTTYLKLVVIGLVLMVFRLYMLTSKIKLYYKER